MDRRRSHGPTHVWSSDGAGHSCSVFSRTASKCDELVAKGATASATKVRQLMVQTLRSLVSGHHQTLRQLRSQTMVYWLA